MADPISIFKAVTGAIGSVFSYFSKYFVQPKIEISWQRSTRTDGDNPFIEDKAYTVVMDYEYELRFTNNSEYPAYHLRFISCNVEAVRNTIDYNLPIAPHASKTYYVNVKRKYKHDKAISKMPEPPTKHPIEEFVIEYENGKGRKFTTTYKPLVPIQERNKFNRL